MTGLENIKMINNIFENNTASLSKRQRKNGKKMHSELHNKNIIQKCNARKKN